MKRALSGLLLIFLLITSCEQEEINDVYSSVVVDVKNKQPLAGKSITVRLVESINFQETRVTEFTTTTNNHGRFQFPAKKNSDALIFYFSNEPGTMIANEDSLFRSRSPLPKDTLFLGDVATLNLSIVPTSENSAIQYELSVEFVNPYPFLNDPDFNFPNNYPVVIGSPIGSLYQTKSGQHTATYNFLYDFNESVEVNLAIHWPDKDKESIIYTIPLAKKDEVDFTIEF